MIPSAAQYRRPKPPSPDQIRSALRVVKRWCGWFIPTTGLLAAVLWMRLDYRFIAVCLLSFPMITIRLVQAWGDYQQLREAANRSNA